MCSRFLQRQLLRMVSEVTTRLAFPGGCVQCRVADLQRKVTVETESSPEKARTFRVSAAKKRCIANASALLSDQSATACFEHRKNIYSLLVLLFPNILLPAGSAVASQYFTPVADLTFFAARPDNYVQMPNYAQVPNYAHHGGQ